MDAALWQNSPERFSENQLPARAWFDSSAGRAEALAGLGGSRSLNGLWRVRYNDVPLPEPPPGFLDAEDPCADWGSIEVPACAELAGFGTPQYVNTMYPWDGLEDVAPGHAPTRHNPTLYYVTGFELSHRECEEKALYLRFEGAASCLALWVNGQYVGYAEDSFTPSEFDIGAFAKPGWNKLAVQVIKWCDGSWLEDQDFWRLSGIFRDVSLLVLPCVHLFDFCADYGLDMQRRSAHLKVSALVAGARAGQDDCAVEAELLDPDGAVLERMVLPPAQADGWRRTDISLPDVRLWSAEKPCLYTLVLSVKSGAGQEWVAHPLGFRRIDIEDGVLRLNGERLVFRGVNRHEWSAARGRSITYADMVWDVQTMKRHNVNAVRCAHYPNHPAFYTLCDRWGLYVIDEVNLETQGTWNHLTDDLQPDNGGEGAIPHSLPEWTEAVLARANAVYQRDKNHPSVIMWSLGNEAFGGENFRRMHRFFKEVDPSRPVHYEGVDYEPGYDDVTDVRSTMYYFPERAEAWLRENPDKPYIQCEYAHTMNNSGGGLEEYRQLTLRYPNYQGGFIWDWIDQAIESPPGSGHLLYGGDFGDRPHDGEFCCNGVVFADRTLSPKMQAVKGAFAPALLEVRAGAGHGTVRVRNLLAFTDLCAYAARAELWLCGRRVAAHALEIALPPDGEGEFPLPEWDAAAPGDYLVRVTLADGDNDVALGEASFRLAGDAPPAAAGKGPPALTRGIFTWGVAGKGFSMLFSKRLGYLYSLNYGGVEYLKAPVAPNFWRAPTDNDRGAFLHRELGVWRSAGEAARYTGIRAEESGDAVTVTLAYRLPTAPEAGLELAYTIRADGSLEIEYRYTSAPGLPEVPEHALMFTLDAALAECRYWGLGPEENYPDRTLGAHTGWHSLNAAQNLTAYTRPQECGMRCGVTRAHLHDGAGCGIMLEAEAPFCLSVLPYTPEQLVAARHPFELPAPCRTVVRVAGFHAGVGGDDSWGSLPRQRYRLSGEKDFCFRVTLRQA